MAGLRTGDCFSSFADVEARISALEAETNSKFYKSISLTLRNFLIACPDHYISKAIVNKPDKEAFLEEKKYRLIKFACTNGGRKNAGKADRVRNTKTETLDCTVFITVVLDKSLQLVVKDVNLEHSHAVSKASCMLQPENRRLTEAEKNVARQFHQAGADKKRIRQHQVDRHGKALTRHDLNNALRAPKSSESDLEAAIGLLSERGFTSTVVEDGGTVCGLFFHDLEMRSAYEKFPEFLLMDSAYKLVDSRAPVFTILAVDSFGRGVPLSVFLVTNKTPKMVGAMLRVFREHNAAAANGTKVWLTDNAQAERAAIREVFPDCDQFICSFHVLQSFRREVDLTGVNKAERERILQILQQLVFASSDSEYSRLRAEIRHPATDTYLKDNWDNIRSEWAQGLSGVAMSGVFTNNHLASLHGKLKSGCRADDSLPKFITSYLGALSTVRADRKAAIHSEMNKHLASCRFSELKEYQLNVTSFALSLLEEELKQCETVTLGTSPGGQQTARDLSGVVGVSPTTCGCLFRQRYALPCRHIMAARQARQMCLFSEEMIAQKWLLMYAADRLEAQGAPRAPPSQSVSIRRLPPAGRPLTEGERFKQLEGITSQIASAGFELSGQKLHELTEQLTQVLDFLQRGRTFAVVEVQVQSDDSDEPAVDDVMASDVLRTAENMSPECILPVDDVMASDVLRTAENKSPECILPVDDVMASDVLRTAENMSPECILPVDDMMASDVLRTAENKSPECILPVDDMMAGDVLSSAGNESPEYILPDDPMESTPGFEILKEMKGEPSNPTSRSSSTTSDDSQGGPVEVMEEDPIPGPSGSPTALDLGRVVLDASEVETKSVVPGDDEFFGLVKSALSQALRPVMRRCDEVLPQPDGVQVSAITAEQHRALGRVDGEDIPLLTDIFTDFVKMEVAKPGLEDDPTGDDLTYTISEAQHSPSDSDSDGSYQPYSHYRRGMGRGRVAAPKSDISPSRGSGAEMGRGQSPVQDPLRGQSPVQDPLRSQVPTQPAGGAAHLQACRPTAKNCAPIEVLRLPERGLRVAVVCGRLVLQRIDEEDSAPIPTLCALNFMELVKLKEALSKLMDKCIREGPADHVPRLRTARRTSISLLVMRLRAESVRDMRGRPSTPDEQGKSKCDAPPGGPTPPAQRTVSAAGDAARDRGSPVLLKPTSDDPENATPGPTMSVEIKEETVGATTSSSSADGLTRLGTEDCSYNSIGQECAFTHANQHQGHAGRNGNDDFTIDGNSTILNHRDSNSDGKGSGCDHSCDTHPTNRRQNRKWDALHTCGDCGKTFTRHGGLKRHMRIHTEERSYICDKCGMTFNVRDNLIKHRRIHAMEKPHSCDDCGKTFTRRDCLLRHQRIHARRAAQQ